MHHFASSGVIDVNGSTVSSDDLRNHIRQRLSDKNQDENETDEIYIIPHSSNAVNEYYNPLLLLGLYPSLFCFGRGAPEDQSRSVPINFQEHVRYFLSYNDRRFEKNHSFIFVIFNILQRRQACFQAKLIASKPYFKNTSHEINTLTSEDIQKALENNMQKNNSTELNNPTGHLFRHIKTIGGRVMGSAYSRTALRTKLHALIYNQGLPHIFLTLNPADIHSPLALYFAGEDIDLDNFQANKMMDTYKRAAIIASHPVATAKSFHTLISNIINTLIVGGILGPIKAYFGTVESQGRGSLHLHLLVWLDLSMKPVDFRKKIKDPKFRDKLKSYLEDVIKEDLEKFKNSQNSNQLGEYYI